nr:sugar phosphate isomerase/epimerase family protein [uncultured Arsenicibacter sp.]
MEIGIFAKTYTGSFDAICRQIQAAGIHRIQFNYACAGLSSLPHSVDASTLADVQQCLTNHSLTVDAVSGTFNMIHPDPAQREHGLTALTEIARTCHALQTRLITLCTGSRDPNDMWKAHPANNEAGAWYDLRATLDRALVIAGEHGLCLGVEPETANVINTVEKAARLLKEVHSPYLKIVFDPANLFEQEPGHIILDRIQKGLDLLGDAVISAHAKDRAADGRVAAAGHGKVPFPAYLERLSRTGYTGSLIIHGLQPAEVPDTKHYLQSVLNRITNRE